MQIHFTSMTTTAHLIKKGGEQRKPVVMCSTEVLHTLKHKQLIVSDELFLHRCRLDNNGNCWCSFVCLCVAQRSLCYWVTNVTVDVIILQYCKQTVQKQRG